MKQLLKPSLDWLLILIPVVLWLEHFRPESHTLIFALSGLAIVPLAGWLGHATEHLAERAGEGIGGLLNATFGNAAELIIALSALNKGLYDVVKASITGSIIGNILLVLGAAFVAGGTKFKVQRFNASGARAQSTSLSLAAIALVLPAAFHFIGGRAALLTEGTLSRDIAIVLLLVYGLTLLFSLKTHPHFFASDGENHGGELEKAAPWSTGKSVAVLGIATAAIAWMSEILVGSVEPAARALGMTEVFVGVIVVAVVGNAAEHSTAILMALRNRMDLAIGIAVGSSVQVALLVAPLLVLASYFIGPAPMNLVFSPAEVLAVFLSVLIAYQVCGDGESNWLEGAQLLAVYIILGIVFYFLPA